MYAYVRKVKWSKQQAVIFPSSLYSSCAHFHSSLGKGPKQTQGSQMMMTHSCFFQVLTNHVDVLNENVNAQGYFELALKYAIE